MWQVLRLVQPRLILNRTTEDSCCWLDGAQTDQEEAEDGVQTDRVVVMAFPSSEVEHPFGHGEASSGGLSSLLMSGLWHFLVVDVLLRLWEAQDVALGLEL